LNEPKVLDAYALNNLSDAALPEHIKMQVVNGYNKKRGGDVGFILKPGYIAGGSTGTSHDSWNPYDSHIPLLWYGWKVKPGKTNREIYMTDAAATIAAMLRIQMPSGCIGKPITEITGNQ